MVAARAEANAARLTSAAPGAADRAITRRVANPVKIVVPTPIVDSAAPQLEAVAEGIASDLVDLLRRLGGAWAVPLYLATSEVGGDEPHWESGDELDLRTADRLIQDFAAQGLVALRLSQQAATIVTLSARLIRRGRVVAWSVRVPVVDGAVREARLALGSDLLAAATGQPTDASAVAALGTRSLGAWLAACEARYHRRPLEDRIDAARRACELDPMFAEAWLLWVDLRVSAGDLEGAAAVATGLPDRFRRLGRAWLARARVRHQTRDVPGARLDLTEALALPLDGPSWLDAATLAFALEDPASGQRLLEAARDARLMDPLLFDRLGDVRHRERREIEAVALWERAYTLSRATRGLRSKLALGHHRLGNAERARLLFDEAMTRDVRLADTWYHYARYLEDVGRDDELLAHLDRAIRIDPSHGLALARRGSRLAALDRGVEARADLDLAVIHAPEGTPEATEARQALRRLIHGPQVIDRAADLLAEATAAVREGRHPDAIAPLGEALRLLPDYWQAWFMLGTAHRQAGRWVPAEGAFRQVLKHQPEQPEAWNELSASLVEQGRTEKALEAALRGHRLRPTDPVLLAGVGVAQMEAGDLASARASLERALTLNPEDPVVQRCVADLESREVTAGLSRRAGRQFARPAGTPARADPPPRVTTRSPGAPSPGPRQGEVDLDDLYDGEDAIASPNGPAEADDAPPSTPKVPADRPPE